MRRRSAQVAAASCAGALLLTSCATNVDVPKTFAATITVTGQAEQVETGSGECVIDSIRVAPNDQIDIFGGSGAASTRSALEVEAIDQLPDGMSTCSYTAHFDAVPANQRNYEVSLGHFSPESFSSDELENGVTYQLRRP
ncbi:MULTISPECIES: hypothetical protein [Rhodococcus erythropolis group]|jgi:hypothetical protein|uniref:hypothetical protein n=1 Tax=Rhodococcus erythropolis group TaxID=2840174 RepID=UPI001CD9A19C|nr:MULTISPECIES: hypothetical protein [Rhodococcus erythropolis group]MBW0291033.1 hypothetical protein [Rhodococcus sp. MH15]MCT6732217.1 hypothetical protein [Rhodococcus qingshengii]MDJ0434465.1 hypothetical protein [Rhodococcus qingshengii]